MCLTKKFISLGEEEEADIYEHNPIRRGKWNYNYAGKRKQEVVDKNAQMFGGYLEIIIIRPVALWENVLCVRIMVAYRKKGNN